MKVVKNNQFLIINYCYARTIESISTNFFQNGFFLFIVKYVLERCLWSKRAMFFGAT